MTERYCQHCGGIIPATRRSDAKYCNPKCGWEHRNALKAQREKQKREYDRKLHRNYKIIYDLYHRGKTDIPFEALEIVGFDTDLITGINEVDKENKITKYDIYEFKIELINNRCLISKKEV